MNFYLISLFRNKRDNFLLLNSQNFLSAVEAGPLAADALADKSGVLDYKLLINLNPQTPRFYGGK